MSNLQKIRIGGEGEGKDDIIELYHCQDRTGRCYWDDFDERGNCDCSCPGCNPD